MVRIAHLFHILDMKGTQIMVCFLITDENNEETTFNSIVFVMRFIEKAYL